MARTFRGYRRSNGQVGIRNYIAVIPGVYCSEVAAKKIAAHYSSDEVTFVANSTGCGQSRADKETTLDIFAGLIANGNVYAYPQDASPLLNSSLTETSVTICS